MQETWVDPCVRKIPWRRKWQPTPVFLPGEFWGQRSLEGYSPGVQEKSDMTEAAERRHAFIRFVKETRWEGRRGQVVACKWPTSPRLLSSLFAEATQGAHFDFRLRGFRSWAQREDAKCRTLTLKGCGQPCGQASPLLGRRLSFATHACAVCERKKENRLIMSPCHRAQLEASLVEGMGLGFEDSLPGGRVWGYMG